LFVRTNRFIWHEMILFLKYLSFTINFFKGANDIKNESDEKKLDFRNGNFLVTYNDNLNFFLGPVALFVWKLFGNPIPLSIPAHWAFHH